MNIQTLIEESKGDLRIHPDNLVQDSINTPSLIAKWIQWFTMAKLELKRLEYQLATTRKERYEYYHHGDYDFHVDIDKRDMFNLYINGDEEVQAIQKQVDFAKEKVDFIDSVIRTLQNRSYAIRNALDYMKFMAGVD